MLKLLRYNIATILLTFLLATPALAQFPPPAGNPGTTAIHTDSSVFIAWANECTLDRGYADISNQSLGTTTYGTSGSAIGKADNNVVSLGDNGIATVGFEVPIANGNGWDFAVFENSFSDEFLELAFVEVSSNGIDYFRFSSVSLTDQNTQISTFGVLDATKINNLAGKYSLYYGVPFDLEELKDIPELDVDNIISIRIIDVVGCIDSLYATFDSQGNIINDPWPTPFETSGFDLDAVGVINNRDNTGTTEISYSKGIVYPNPANDVISIKSSQDIDEIIIASINGKTIKRVIDGNTNKIEVSNLLPGYYIIYIVSDNQIITDKLAIY